jgi:hypothetical protein
MRFASSIALVVAFTAAAHANIIFRDDFSVPGSKLDLSEWTTEVGPSSFLGRTQLADWVTPGAIGEFNVGAEGAELALNTHNPTGFSLYGTHGKTHDSFLPGPNKTLEFTTRMRLTSFQPGLVYGMYFFSCNPGNCAAQHDEIDIELLTNELQPGGPLQVQLNRYANEPLGPGHGGLVDLPPGFDPLATHDWTIRWSRSRIDYLVDGVLLGSETTFIPQAPMHVNMIAWGPGTEWPAAYDPSLQPVSTAAENQSFVAFVRSVEVRESAVPEPESAALMLLGVLGVALKWRLA